MPRGIEGSRRPCRRAASWGACAGVHDEACGSERWRLWPPPIPWSRERSRPSGSPRAGCPLGRPQRKALRALLSFIRRIRSGLIAPPGAGTLAESNDALCQSISSALPKRSSSLWCSSSHTPASFHSLRRRQQVIPEPQPISWGNISQGMPLFSTNNMPVSAARSSTRGLPPLGFGGSSGNSGSTTPQSSSVTSSLAMVPPYPLRGFVRRTKFADWWPQFSPNGKTLAFDRIRLDTPSLDYEDERHAVFVQRIDTSGSPEDA